MARILMTAGAAIFLIGAAWWGIGRLFPGFGRLPGDILIRKGNFTFYFPLATSLLLSLGLTLILWLLRKL